MGFIITRPDGSERAVSGYRFAAPREGTRAYEATAVAQDDLPAKVDLRPFMTAVENQGQTSSCVANAVAGAYEYLVKRHQGEDAYDVSRMFIYFNARKLDGMEAEDGGSLIGTAIEGLKQFGACSEETWPFVEESVNEEPAPEAYEEASGFLVEDTALVPTDVNAWRSAIAEGHPIIFGISLFKSFDQQRKKGLVPVPSPSESSRESHGGHAMLAVGYSDKDKVFIVRNSWGTEWGDNGYCYIPYSYLCNPKFNGGDSWIIKQLEGATPNQETWADDEDESVLPDLDHELASMSDEDYGAMIEAMGEVPLETRIAQIFLVVASGDGELSDEELEGTASYMATVMQQLGSDLDPAKVLRFAMRHVEDEELLNESVQLLGEHLSNGMLASILSALQEVVGADGLEEGEEDLIAQLVEAWQVEE